MERRTFFKVIGALAASAAIPSTVTTLIEASQAAPTGMAQLGLIREVCAYDIYRDETLARYDILTADGKLQLGVDTRLTAEDAASLAWNRGVAKEMLENELRHCGLTWADLQPMPLPLGYTPPAWIA